MTGFLAIFRNVIRSTIRARTALIFTLLLPIFWMGLFGAIFGGSGPAVPLGIVDRDHSPLSAALIHALKAQSGLKVEVGSFAHERDRLNHDDVVLLAVIPSAFQSAVRSSSGGPAVVTTYLDRNQLQSAALAQGAFAQITNGFAQQSSGRSPRVVLHASRVNTTNVTTLDFYLPSMIAYIVLVAGVQSVAIALVDLRERRVLRRFQATPLSALQILAGQIIGRAATVVLQVIVLVAVGLLIFKAQMHGSWLLASLSIALGIMCFVAIGFMITGFARTSEAARAIASFFIFPMMFLSGVFISVNQLPSSLQPLVHLLPLTYLTDALHAILNDGKGISAIWTDWALLAAWTVVCFAVAVRRFRWE